jgi:glycosyltransferase involved in cell wall biosynthesis
VARVTTNRQTFVSQWGPRLFRDALLDALEGGHRYSNDPVHVAIAAGDGDGRGGEDAPGGDDQVTARRLGDALRALGWRVSVLAPVHDGLPALELSVEAIVVLDHAFDIRGLPRKLITMAWIGDQLEPWLERVWFDEFDLVFVPSELAAETVRQRSAKVARVMPISAGQGATASPDGYGPAAAEVRDAVIGWASATRYGLRVGVTSWDVIDRWGDYHFARGLQRALERAGHPTRVHFLPDWSSEAAARDDVAILLFGLKEAPTHRGQVNILWQISHPDLATPELYDRYDHVFVASDTFAAWMAGLVAVPVTPLHQATDPGRFRPEPGGPHHELLFVANSRRVHRRVVDDLAGTTRDLAIYGREWTPALVDQRFVKGENVPNTELARYYSAADIVLNDHWDDMRFEGFISNRLYDALACGSFVISDEVDGIEAEFDGAVVTYDTRAELEALIARYLGDPDERRRLATLGRAAVLQRHTFDLRARVLCDVVEPLAMTHGEHIEQEGLSPRTAVAASREAAG